MSSDPKLVPFILPLIDGEKILDVACGKGKWGYLLKVDFWYTAGGRPLRGRELEFIVGIDIFLPYLKFVKKHEIYDDLVLCDASHLPFRSKSFDITLATEVLEHMAKRDGISLLKEIERVSTKSTVITTPRNPIGLFHQDIKDKNEHQRHVSKWNARELRALGYTVIGKSFPFESFLDIASFIFPRLTSMIPQTPFSLIARKNLRIHRSARK